MHPKEAPRAWPQIEAIFESDNTEPFLRRVEKSCKQLSAILANGSPAEKQRANAVLLAFGHATGLVKELGELRFKLAEETSTRPQR